LRKNVQAQNYNFNEKKNAYANIDNVISSFVITQEILKEEKWNVDSLERRHEKLIARIYDKLLVF
jgi:glutamyl-tRNA reductase